MKRKVIILRINELRVHELIQRERVEELKKDILREGKIKRPILVDENTLIVIDGHHRLQALKELGCKFIPAVLVNYRSNDICVEPWRDCDKISKEDVIKAGLTGNPFPPKTSKHFIICEGCKRHVEYLEGEFPVHLSVLGSSIKRPRISSKLT